MSIVHDGDFDESGVSAEEAREIEDRKKESDSDSSEQEEELEEKETQEEDEQDSDEETEDNDSESDEDESDKDDSEDEDEDDDSDEGDESDEEDDSADDTSKANKGLSRREEKLENSLSAKRDRIKALRKLNKRADEKIDKLSESSSADEDEESEDDEDFLSEYDEKQISRYMRKQGYVKKDELDRTNLKDTVHSEQEEFFDKHPEYLQEEELAEDLLEYADDYKDPRKKGDWARSLKRAHADRLRDLKIKAKHTPASTKRAKKAAMAVETGGGSTSRSSQSKAKQGDRHKPRSDRQKAILLQQGWSEEDLA